MDHFFPNASMHIFIILTYCNASYIRTCIINIFTKYMVIFLLISYVSISDNNDRCIKRDRERNLSFFHGPFFTNCQLLNIDLLYLCDHFSETMVLTIVSTRLLANTPFIQKTILMTVFSFSMITARNCCSIPALVAVAS